MESSVSSMLDMVPIARDAGRSSRIRQSASRVVYASDQDYRVPEVVKPREEGGCARALIPTVPLIDRERELDELRGALDAALGGRGRALLVGGEPGSGKTRLAGVLPC